MRHNQHAGTPKTVLLFDLDGTLLDSTPLVLASSHYALRTVLGRDVTDDELRPYFGQILEDQFRQLTGRDDPQLIERLILAYRAFNEAAHDEAVDACAGARETVRALASSGVGLGIVSSKRLSMVNRGLDWLGLRSLFRVVVGSESTVRHKPDPAPIERALQAWPAVCRGQVAMVGDSPYDIEAAVRAGIDGIGVLGNTFSRRDLEAAGAVRVLDRLPELLTWMGWELDSRRGLGP
jgi:pyrophosphatase PpaX